MNIIPPINAIPSWDGYEYQGHVALCYSLKVLSEAIKNDSVSQWELEIEGKEDFSILFGNQYESFHQVKQGQVSLSQEDKFAFIIGILQDSAKCGYFHINSTENIPNDFVTETQSYIDTLLRELSKPVKRRAELLSGDNEQDYIIIEKINVNTPKASVYRLLNYQCGKDRDKTNVENKVASLVQNIEEYKRIIEEEKASFLLANPTLPEDRRWLSVYDKRWDSSADVMRDCIHLIYDIIHAKEPSWIFADEVYCGYVYKLLHSMLLERVSYFNEHGASVHNCRLSFTEIYDCISKNHSLDSQTKDFLYYFFIKSMIERYREFSKNYCNEVSCATCSNKANCNVYAQLEQLLNKDIITQCEIAFNLLLEEPKKQNNLPSDNLIDEQLLKAIKDIEGLRVTSQNSIMAKSSDGNFYWLSLDDSRSKEALQKKLKTGLLEAEDKSFIYECDVLVTDKLNEQYFLLDGADVNVLEAEELTELTNLYDTKMNLLKNDVHRAKIIRLIDKNSAEAELQ